jgi:mono/diheme cytochrome c family protein
MAVAVFCAGMQPLRAWGEDASVAEGKSIFQAKCSPCHTIGGGRLVGPDLRGVTAIRDHEWLERFISAPDKLLAGGDPIASKLLKEYGGVAMPNLGLSSSEVDGLIAYLTESTPKKTTALPAASPEATEGDPQRGVKLFTGAVSFQRGGAPCIACHTVSGVAPLGGGFLGPDLTGIYGRLGAGGLPPLLATLPFPTMQPIYQSRPLTPTERGDLAALFRTAAGRRPADSLSRIIVLTVAGFLLLLLLTGVVWRKRLKSVRRVLVAAMTETGGDRR